MIYQTITLTGSGGNVTVNASGYSVQFAGPLSGPGGLAFAGGVLTLATSDTYRGNTLVSGGTLLLSGPLSLQNSTLDTSGSGLMSFGSLNAATLGGLTGTGVLNLANNSSGTVALGVGNNNASTTFSGVLKGAGSLTKIGSGGLLLTGSNSYAGGTAVNGGILQAAGTASLPGYSTAGKITVSNGGVLAVSAGGSGWTSANIAALLAGNGSHFVVGSALGIDTTASNFSYGSNIAGSMGVTKLGTNSLTLSGSNTYTGRTTITLGTLIVDGWLTRSAVSVNGGTLAGTGYLGSVSVSASGHLAPGDLNTGALILAGSADFEGGELDIAGTGSSITSLSIAGNLSLNNDPTLNFSGSLTPGTYTIASYGGTLNGTFATLNIPAGDTINYGTGSNSSITISAVPEPSSVALLAAGALGLVGYVWRRQRTVKPAAFDRQDPLILSFASHWSSAHAARRAA